MIEENTDPKPGGSGTGTGGGETGGDSGGSGGGGGSGGSGGGTTVTTFSYLLPVSPKVKIPGSVGNEGCSFYTLGTITGGNPCQIAQDYFNRYEPYIKLPYCDFSRESDSDPDLLVRWYRWAGVNFLQQNVYISSLSDMISVMSPGGKGILVDQGYHIYLIYEIDLIGGVYQMSKYDTGTEPYNKPFIPVEVPSSGRRHIIN